LNRISKGYLAVHNSSIIPHLFALPLGWILTNSIYFKFSDQHEKMAKAQKVLAKVRRQRRVLKKCKLFTKSKTDFGNKFVMHVTCPNNACASSCACVCASLPVCACGRLKEIWISEFKKRWRRLRLHKKEWITSNKSQTTTNKIRTQEKNEWMFSW